MMFVLAALITITALTTPLHNTPQGVTAAPMPTVWDRDHDPSPPHRQPQQDEDTTSLLDSVGAMFQHLSPKELTGLHFPDLYLPDPNLTIPSSANAFPDRVPLANY